MTPGTKQGVDNRSTNHNIGKAGIRMVRIRDFIDIEFGPGSNESSRVLQMRIRTIEFGIQGKW